LSDEIQRVYKFYGADRALDNLSKYRLKVSTLADLNDPFEFRSFVIPHPVTRAAWEKMRTQLFEGKGIICFCKSWDNPVIWSHYADNHRGIALGFDIPSKLLLPVKYRKIRAPFPNISTISVQSATTHIKNTMATKFVHWEYENETRVFVDANEACSKTGLYFKSFDEDLVLKEVIIGPNSAVSSEELEKTTDLTGVRIVTSRLAFKSYRVIKQRKHDLQK